MFVWRVVWEVVMSSLFFLFPFVSVLFFIRIFLFNLRIIGRGRLVRNRQEARRWESGWWWLWGSEVRGAEERRGGTGEYDCVIVLVVVDSRWGYWSKLVRVRVFLKAFKAGAVLGLISYAIAIKLLTVF